MIVPRMSIQEGIDAVRRMFGNVYIDSTKCQRGIECLESYHKEFDEKNKVYRSTPKHDWASNSADAFRYLGVSYLQLTQNRYN